MSTTLDQVILLARRSVVRTVRQPANVIGPLVFPLLLLSVNAGGLKAETHLPGFPTNSFVAFALAVPFIQGALFATMNAGTDFARDIQTGFLSRLSLTPMRGVALLAGQLGGAMTLGAFQAVVYAVLVGQFLGHRVVGEDAHGVAALHAPLDPIDAARGFEARARRAGPAPGLHQLVEGAVRVGQQQGASRQVRAADLPLRQRIAR